MCFLMSSKSGNAFAQPDQQNCSALTLISKKDCAGMTFPPLTGADNSFIGQLL